MLQEIKAELQRMNASKVSVKLDSEYEPDAGELVHVEIEDASWHMLPGVFLALLKDLPDAADAESVRTAIERRAMFVWHGPSPKDSRDTSP